MHFDITTAIGILGGVFYLASHYMKAMVPLRVLALASSGLFLIFSVLHTHFDITQLIVLPEFLLNLILLPINAKRLAEIIKLGTLSEAIFGNQSLSFLILMQQLERAGEVNAGQIFWPLLWAMFVEIIAQIKDVIRSDDAFARENVDGIGHGSRVRKSRRLAPGYCLQVAQTRGEHFRWRRKPGSLRLAKKIHHVNRNEADVRTSFRRPITETTLVVLSAPQGRERFLELRAYFRAFQTEIDFIRKQQTAKCCACDLLAATVRKIFQVNIESVRQTKRQRRNRSLELAEVRAKRPIN